MGSHHPIIIFHTKEINDDSSLIDRPNFSVHHENWKSAEDRPELVDELHRRNLIKDGFFASKGMLNRLVRPFHLVLLLGHWDWPSPTVAHRALLWI